jgi:uncharacterized membrane protein
LTILRPEYLWALLLVPVILVLRGRTRREGGARGWFITLVRCALVALLALVLAQPAVRRRSDFVATYFVLDRSASVTDEAKARSLETAKAAIESKKRKEDRAGLIVFGDRAQVEEMPRDDVRVGEIFSVVDPQNTDIAAAVRLALSTFPDDAQKRIVLFTDGNETKGSLAEAARRAAAARVPIDVVPLKYRYENEVLLDELTLPRKVEKDEPFQMRINVASLGASQGTLRIFCDGKLIGSKDVALAKGDNVFVFSHMLKEAGFHLFEAQIDGPKDGIVQNNRAQAYTIIEQDAMVLIAGGTPDDVNYVAAAMRDSGILYRTAVAGSLPRDLGEWQSYDAIIFANLAAEHLSPQQMSMIESLVRDLGAGFIMIGGENSFGAGGYLNTPIARLLPVDLDVNQNMVMPNGGVVFLLDHIHCIGNGWSKDIACGTLRAMHRMDEFGLMAGGQNWVVPLESIGDKQTIIQRVNACYPGDIQDVNEYIRRAIEAFAARRIGFRHIVLITDGLGNIVPSDASIARLREARITLSVALIEPNGNNTAQLREAARAGGGNFYVVQPSQREMVPQIILRESTRVKKGLFFEDRFTPSVVGASEILEGISPSDIPALNGYNVTSRKSPTEVPMISSPHKDAVLAHWNCGLGKAVAFTSDASGRWGADWVRWPRFNQFWSQAVRWCQRRIPASPYQLTIQRGRQEGTAEAIIDAVDPQGRFVNFLAPGGTLVKPGLETEPMTFQQIGPGRYRAAFATDATGGYVVNVRYQEGGKTYLLRGGYVPPYNPEYRRFQDNEPLLTTVAEQTGGRVATPGMDWFAPTGQVAYTSKPLWPLLLAIAVCLLPFDIFVRRVIVGIRDVVAAIRAIVPRWRVRRDPVADALAAARGAMRVGELATFTPGAGSAEVGAEAEAEGASPSEGSPEEAGPELTNRLAEAKKRARKKFEK